jgi:hypothetical protein
MNIHQNYDTLSEQQRKAVDAAYNAAAIVLKAAGFNTAGDDRAERLVEALATYLVESIEI